MKMPKSHLARLVGASTFGLRKLLHSLVVLSFDIGSLASVAAFLLSYSPCGVHIPRSMKSMTGYGRGECARNGFKIAVELSSVNRKQGELSLNLPRELEVLEAQVRDEINRRIARGRLTARVSLHAAEAKETARVHLNAPLAQGLCETTQ